MRAGKLIILVLSAVVLALCTLCSASAEIKPIPIDYSCLSDTELIHLAETGVDPREWQTEIMDQNDERSGLASGNAG